MRTTLMALAAVALLTSACSSRQEHLAWPAKVNAFNACLHGKATEGCDMPTPPRHPFLTWHCFLHLTCPADDALAGGVTED